MLLEEKYSESLPTWWSGINNKDYYLVLGDDCDSYASCYTLRKKFKMEVGGFYDFNRGFYLSENIKPDDKREPIFVDCCMHKYKCIDNHYSFLMNRNPEMLTLNRGITQTNYSYKYNGGCYAMLASLLTTEPEKKSVNFWMNVLCIDGFYMGCYNNGGRYAHINYNWFKRLGILEYVKPIIEAHDAKYFQDYINDRGLNRHFLVNKEGYIETNKKYANSQWLSDLPTEKYNLVMPVAETRCQSYQLDSILEEREIVSAASTYKGQYQYSYKI